MDVQIKNVKFNERLSEETLCFSADIYLGKVKVGWASNHGQGGSTDYGACLGKEASFKTAASLCQSSDSNLETFIDDAVYDIYNQKEKLKAEKKVAKYFDKYICFGVKGSESFTTLGFKGSPKFVDVVKTEKGLNALQNLVDRIIREELGKEETVWNTNLSSLGISV